MRWGCFLVLTICTLISAAAFSSTVRAGGITLPADAVNALNEMYGGDPDAAITTLHGFEQTQAQNPLGFLLEAEARWWKIYCAACEIKWGMVDAWRRGKEPGDDGYFALADKAITLAQTQLAKSDSAEMHLYAGMGWALKARLYSLRGENRNVARTGVMARTEFLRATQLDPQMADAWAGIGLYNYYVDTLSPIVKVLRFFMGIPGGNKKEGIRQMEMGANEGAIFTVEARFNLAKSLRTYDEQYEQAAALMDPLVARYPHNPVFLLLLGNLNAELGRNAKASTYFHAAMDSSAPDAACAAHTQGIANSFLAKLH
jgi:tetratricopeptide (TPR) repeat protein